jgi:hypothetical protein
MTPTPAIAELSKVFQFPAPAPAQERGASLRDRVMDLQVLADTVEALDPDDLDPELREDLTRDVIAAVAGTKEKVDRVGDCLSYFEVAQLAAQREIDRLEKRKAHFARAQARLENYVLSVIECSQFTKLEGHVTTLATRQNPPSVFIAEGTVLAPEYLRQPATPPPVADKTALKNAIKRGETIDGVTLQQATRLVRT